MKLLYYPETNSLCFKPEAGPQTGEITNAVNAYLDAAGEIVGFDIDRASRHVYLVTLEPADFLRRTTKAA